LDLKSFIRDVPDFPKEGILYRDIQPLLENQDAFFDAVLGMAELVEIPQYWVGIESRGFIFASALSMQYGGGIKLIRKAGKLPNTLNTLHTLEYELEYGSDIIEMQGGWGDVIIVDDVLATGGTIRAAERLCTNAGYQVIDTLCLLDIGLMKNHDIKCLISY
jgi:adenine phosphoribosyltransferase